jgi:hypothetical protein
VHPDRLGLALGAQLTASVLEIADQFLLLGVDRDGGLACGLERLHLGVDIPELRIAAAEQRSQRVRMVHAFPGLAVGLQAKPQAPQQPSHQLLAGAEAALGQGTGQTALAAADQHQRRLQRLPAVSGRG